MITAIPRSVSCQSADAVGAATTTHGRGVVTVDGGRSTEERTCCTETVIALNVVSPSEEGIELMFDRTYV
jgi:hypothetical protein